jgi:opacity protein-like surface antigen
MAMRWIAAAFAAGALLCATPATAEDADWGGLYGALGYTGYDVGVAVPAGVDDEEVAIGGVTTKAGYKITDHIGVEVDATFGVRDQRVDLGGGISARVELDYQIAAYAVAYAPVGDSVELFARAGYARTEYSLSGLGASANDSDSGLSYGAGAMIWANERTGFRAEYTRFEADDFEDADAFTVSVVFAF